MKKKICITTLMLCMVLGTAGCGQKKAETEATKETTVETAAETEMESESKEASVFLTENVKTAAAEAPEDTAGTESETESETDSGIKVELTGVTVTLPESWKDHYDMLDFGDATIFYQSECRAAGDGGHLFTIETFTDTSYTSLPSYEVLGTLQDAQTQDEVTYVWEEPTDVQSGTDETNAALYQNMSLDLNYVKRNLKFDTGFVPAETETESESESETETATDLTAAGQTETNPDGTPAAATAPDNSNTADKTGPVSEAGTTNGTSPVAEAQTTSTETDANGSPVWDETEAPVSNSPVAEAGAATTAGTTTTDTTATTNTATSTTTGYILSESNSRNYTQAELSSLDSTALRRARNEIYARHGRKFDDANLQSYFNGCSWYTATVEPAAFDESQLNSFELYNIDLIYKLEGEPALTQ